ncbi:MAG: hypothetical protein V1813_02085 [Candidatus Aenigmatarchaeota archaeon]
MMQVTRIDPVSLAIMLALLGFFTGLILGFAAMVMSASADSIIYLLPLFGAENMSIIARSMLSSLGPLSIVVFAFLFSLEGFIGGFIAAVIYNLAAARFGGVAFTVAEQVQKEKPALQEVAGGAGLAGVASEEAAPEAPAQASEEAQQEYQKEATSEEATAQEEMIPRPRRRAQGGY